ncbi:MAG: pyruvate, phosphate dikinase [Bacillota bacterium]|nr:pyruvate, phosphate dikinase [Bacillota bacterium]
MRQQYVYAFVEGGKDRKSLLGGKGANLAEMTKIGLPVPQGFTITTEACLRFFEKGEELWDDLIEQIEQGIGGIEKERGGKFGDHHDPLLVSVRSGAMVSMPGMMDTILNLGLNDMSVEGLAESTGNPRFAYDSYRRFIQMFGDVAMEIPKSYFEDALESIKKTSGVVLDKDLGVEELKHVIREYKAIYRREKGTDFPSDPMTQLLLAVKAVFRSWNNDRAILYRNLNQISHHLGTAVNVQSMVFGNKGDDSGTGVAFTRNPATGENKVFGEFLMNAQGEDVVAGIRKPSEISVLKEILPDIYDELLRTAKILEEHYLDMQDIEYTIEEGRLFILQTRNGKRTAHAAVAIAMDFYHSGRITKEEAILRVDPRQLDQLLHPVFDEKSLQEAKVIGRGLPASPGAGAGKIYFTADAAVAAHERGETVILVRKETSPEDLAGMNCADGILTSTGGMTSHAAVVARGMGKCCVAGCSDVQIDEDRGLMIAGGRNFFTGDDISLDGSTGAVYGENIKKIQANLSGRFREFMDMADELRTLKVYANADTPRDASIAADFCAEGIGLCRTEHMFFDAARIHAVREMILSRTSEERQIALQKLLPMQREDFVGIFRVMGARPVTVRLLDPPLHEFLPKEDGEIAALAESMGVPFDDIKTRIISLHEFNPMLGHRGCRLAITYPEIARMQSRAIIEAALECSERNVFPEIMIPLVGDVSEFRFVKKEVLEEIEKVFAEQGKRIRYHIGTMIEVPRAALTSGEIASEAEFFSFGTNDLTQMTYGFSRDDSGKFLSEYRQKGIFDKDPFECIDQVGVGRLMKIAVEEGRQSRPDLIIGICGEHGGEPSSVEFCHMIGLDYVSCSPYRVPIARLAAAQAAIRLS